MPTTILVTGATEGIGLETAIALARGGAQVIAHGRDAERAERVRDELGRAAGRRAPEPMLADFSSLAQVRSMVTRLEERQIRLDVLVNNAAAVFPERSFSEDGHEATFAVNHLAPFLLTHGILASPCGKALERIVNVSSMAQRNGDIRLDDLRWERRQYSPYLAYAATKLANVMTTVELARRLARRRIAVNALHPGVAATRLLVQGLGASRGWDSEEEAARTTVWLAQDGRTRGLSGGYYADRSRSSVNPAARDRSLVGALYRTSLDFTGAAAA